MEIPTTCRQVVDALECAAPCLRLGMVAPRWLVKDFWKSRRSGSTICARRPGFSFEKTGFTRVKTRRGRRRVNDDQSGA